MLQHTSFAHLPPLRTMRGRPYVEASPLRRGAAGEELWVRVRLGDDGLCKVAGEELCIVAHSPSSPQ